MTRRRLNLLAALLAFASGSVASAFAGPSRIAIHAKAFDGTRWLESALVVLAGDRIESVGPGMTAPPAGATYINVPHAILTPGYIDCDSSLGIARVRDEPQESASADLLLADAFAPDAGESETLRRSGITLVWLAAGPMSVVGARAALVQPTASGPARILSGDHGLCASLANAASQPDRAPTSVPGQALLIARVAREFPEARPLRIRFDDAGSALAAARLVLSGGEGARGLIVGLPNSDEALAEIRDSARAIPDASGRPLLCLSGLGPSSSMDQLRLAVAAAEQAAFVLGTGSAVAGPRALRWAAAALVAHGVPPDRVLSALTRDAARAVDAGSPHAAGSRGVIEPGAMADLVLWSGDALSPASRVLRAWVSGEEVHAEK